jgi:hypothetical protein
MDITRFDRITVTVAQSSSRRDVLRLFGAAALGAGSLALLGSGESEAKRRRKNKNKKRKKIQHQDEGQGQGQDQPKKPGQSGPTCSDGKKNGSETDVDCGGTCPRCTVGKTCGSRNDCTTALCVSGTCQEPTNPADCGLDTDGSNCATRTNADNQTICTKINGRFFTDGTCAQRCLPTEQCVLPISGGVECVLPCGAPDA